MMMSKEFIKQLVDGCADLTAEKVTEHIYNELKLIEDVKCSVKGINASLTDEHRRYNAKISELNLKLDDYRRICKHWSRIYHPDSSGNGDYYECIICGKHL